MGAKANRRRRRKKRQRWRKAERMRKHAADQSALEMRFDDAYDITYKEETIGSLMRKPGETDAELRGRLTLT